MTRLAVFRPHPFLLRARRGQEVDVRTAGISAAKGHLEHLCVRRHKLDLQVLVARVYVVLTGVPQLVSDQLEKGGTTVA